MAAALGLLQVIQALISCPRTDISSQVGNIHFNLHYYLIMTMCSVLSKTVAPNVTYTNAVLKLHFFQRLNS